MHRLRLLTFLSVALLSTAIGATSARADSIAYVKNGDLYLTPTDASREFQVTTGGGYDHVSQADDGTLLGTYGGHLRRLDRFGNVLSEITTPVSTLTTGVMNFYGPYDADLSPSGRTVAYTWWSKGFSVYGGSTNYEEHNGTGFTSSTALTGFTDAGYKHSTSWDAPEFIDENTVLEANGPGWPSDPIAVETVGSGDPKGWFTDPGNMHPMEPTISRNKRVIATVVGPDRTGVKVYRDGDGQLLGNVYDCFTYSGDATARMQSPTLNADGSLLVYSDGHQLQFAHIADMTRDCPSGENARPAIAGGTSPDWGPADVPTSRPAAPSPAPAPAPQPAPAPAPAPGKHALAIKASGKHSPVKLTITGEAGKVALVAKRGKTVVARKTVTVNAGTTTLKLKLPKRKATVTITATQNGRSATTRVKLAA